MVTDSSARYLPLLFFSVIIFEKPRFKHILTRMISTIRAVKCTSMNETQILGQFVSILRNKQVRIIARLSF